MIRRALLPVGLLCAALLAGCAGGQDQRSEASRINTQLGVSYMQQDNLNQASEALEKALAQDRRNAGAHAAMGVLSERLERFDDADHHFRRSLRLDGEQPSVRNNYGRFLCNRERFDAAQEQFRRAIDDPLYERRHVALANAGLCALRAGDADQAEDFLRRSLERRPDFVPALRRLAQLRYESGDYLSARGYYQRFVERSAQSAETLLLGVRIERELGNHDEAASYALRLRSQFPDSEQAQTLRERERND